MLLLSWSPRSALTSSSGRRTLRRRAPACGVELLWQPGAAGPRALARVVGRSRADLLAALDASRSTTDLARQLGLSPGAVSQHLAALRAAGLLSAARRGREVLYLRTPLADQLQLAASG